MYDKLQPFTIVSLPLTFPNDTFEMADQANIQSDELPDIQPPNPLGFNILLHEGLYIITNKMSRTTVDLRTWLIQSLVPLLLTDNIDKPTAPKELAAMASRRI